MTRELREHCQVSKGKTMCRLRTAAADSKVTSLKGLALVRLIHASKACLSQDPYCQQRLKSALSAWLEQEDLERDCFDGSVAEAFSAIVSLFRYSSCSIA